MIIELPHDKTNKMASVQSDQSLCCALKGKLRTQAFFMRTAKTLIRPGGCPGLSESSPGAQSFCWFCHEAAHIHLYMYVYILFQIEQLISNRF